MSQWHNDFTEAAKNAKVTYQSSHSIGADQCIFNLIKLMLCLLNTQLTAKQSMDEKTDALAHLPSAIFKNSMYDSANRQGSHFGKV